MLQRLRSQSVSRLLIQVTIVVALVPMLLIGWHLYRTAWDSSWREIREKHQLLAQNLATPIQIYINDQRNLLSLIAESISVLPHGSNAQFQQLLTQSLNRTHGLRSLILLDLNGEVQALAMPPDMTIPNTIPFRNEACFVMTRQTSAWSLSNVKPNPFTGEPTIFAGQPVRDAKGHLQAVLLGELDLGFIETLRKQVHFGTKGHAAIVDKTGHVIAHPNPQWMKEMKDLSDWTIVKEMMAGNTGATTFFSTFTQADMMAGYASVPGIGWGIMVPQPEAEVAAQVNAILNSYLIWGAIGFVLALLLAIYMARWITRPLNDLAQAGQDLMQRNLVGNLPEAKADAPLETRQLSRVMQDLVSSLQNSRDQVASFNATLQTRVEEATRRLRESNRRLEEMARSDHLTALANRRYFESCLTQTLSRRSSDLENVCVILIDIDHFKQINDAYGHAAGDTALNYVARLLEGAMRSGDLVARYGGDEFVAYMRCSREIGMERARQLRELIDNCVVLWEDKTIHITASIGLFCQPMLSGTDINHVLERADDAMYEAKKRGRNRVVDISH